MVTNDKTFSNFVFTVVHLELWCPLLLDSCQPLFDIGPLEERCLQLGLCLCACLKLLPGYCLSQQLQRGCNSSR